MKKEKSFQKKRLIAIVIFSLVFIACAAGAMYIKITWPKPELIPLKTGFVISKEKDEEQAGAFGDYQAGVPWVSGAMEFTLEGWEVGDAYKQLGILETELAKGDFVLPAQDQKILKISLRIKNIDAKAEREPGNVAVRSFNISMFHLETLDMFSDLNFYGESKRLHVMDGGAPTYFSGHSVSEPNAVTSNYYHFSLEPGKEQVYQLAFLFPKRITNYDELVVKFGAATVYKYGLLLHEATAEENK